VLEAGFDMPPLMLTPDEIEAAVLGAQWVAGRGDPVLAKAASDLISKIAAAVPDRLRPYVLEPAIGAAPAWKPETDRIDVAQVRAWIHAGRKIRLDYSDGTGAVSARVIWPVTVGYRETIRMIIAWCELRQAFRSFRTDRVVGADFLEDRHGKRPAVLRGEWIKFRDAEIAAWKAKERADCSAA
jgi:predicted DNA-binding transcriptional regulator YafY